MFFTLDLEAYRNTRKGKQAGTSPLHNFPSTIQVCLKGFFLLHRSHIDVYHLRFSIRNDRILFPTINGKPKPMEIKIQGAMIIIITVWDAVLCLQSTLDLPITRFNEIAN